MSPSSAKGRKRGNSFIIITDRIEHDPAHHLAGPFMPQTPLGSLTPVEERSASPFRGRTFSRPSVSPWLRWAIEPVEAFKLLIVPVVLYVNWEVLAPWLGKSLEPILYPILGPYPNAQSANPFGVFFLLSHYIPTSTLDDPRYQKGWFDLAFIAYHIVFWSMVRQFVTINICRPIAKYYGIRKEGKLDRFGEQGYAVFYFFIMGCWGLRIMAQLPTWWYRTEYFWIDYPHWDMVPELKRYYLMQMAYWSQQLLVMLLKFEKPRKDYNELVAHHIVTIWLVGWSYLVNLTLIGNAVYMSMDIPDTSLAFSKLLNYIQWERAKVVSFALFIGIWTYFRHILNLVILYSVWTEFDLIPEHTRVWDPPRGVWLPYWMKYQIFVPIALLQLLNLFWYYLIMRILYRAIMTSVTDDERSDDEDDDEDDGKDTKED
ncbi:longevity assurance proteins LAG1/LAC1 [Armillaria gallica]|uniref:Longevity assurance proteins LAG1/LAC1 n=1 Tax=Armillaria gallica TaxID=47427 RepID=A0A2H3E7U2_ARMGA|nr:longevity assurance proteins LAG1/LAC1 [Armillaria gallica]